MFCFSVDYVILKDCIYSVEGQPSCVQKLLPFSNSFWTERIKIGAIAKFHLSGLSRNLNVSSSYSIQGVAPTTFKIAWK